MFKIKTPNKRFNGERLGVKFVNGVGETEDKSVIKELESYGYTVEQEKKSTPKPKTTKKSGDE